MTAPLDPDKFPDVRPDRIRFWVLRVMCWTFSLVALAAITFGVGHGALAWYATKNGAEVERAANALIIGGGAIAGGLLLLFAVQLARVQLAIEENTRLTAYHSRPRGRPNAERRPAAAPRQPPDL
ncbi:MAG: hypothetical protein VKS61_17580 [Candidatus Sericytochromatia bacterium]|nr:hypothetical protein [Candidatus Sericytochromatia bacterium]